MLWTDACRLVPFFTGPAGEVARPQSLKPRRRPTITHQPGRVQQARSQWPRRPAADARPGAPQPAADGRCHTARQMQRSGRGSSWSGRPAADPSPPALGWSACTRRRLVASILARVCASGRRPAVVLQLSDSQHVVVRERDERRNGADSECGTIGRVCWTGPMVLDTESEGIILFLKDTMVDHSRHRRTRFCSRFTHTRPHVSTLANGLAGVLCVLALPLGLACGLACRRMPASLGSAWCRVLSVV